MSVGIAKKALASLAHIDDTLADQRLLVVHTTAATAHAHRVAVRLCIKNLDHKLLLRHPVLILVVWMHIAVRQAKRTRACESKSGLLATSVAVDDEVHCIGMLIVVVIPPRLVSVIVIVEMTQLPSSSFCYSYSTYSYYC